MLNEIFSQVLLASLPGTMTDDNGRFYRPPEIDAATLKRLYFLRPLMEPCVRTTLLNLRILERAVKGESFYRGKTRDPPEDLWSDLLDIDLNHESRVIHDLSEDLKLYRSGDSPFHFDCFRQMQFTTQTLLKYFIEVFGRTSPFHNALKLFNLASQMLVINLAKGIIDVEWQNDIERFENALKTAFVQICGFLKSFEFNATIPKPMMVAEAIELNAQATAAIVKDTSAAVRTIVDSAASSAADPINFTLSGHDFQQRLNSRLTNLIEAFVEISRVFKKRERERDFEIAFRKLPPCNRTRKRRTGGLATRATNRGQTTRARTNSAETKHQFIPPAKGNPISITQTVSQGSDPRSPRNGLMAHIVPYSYPYSTTTTPPLGSDPRLSLAGLAQSRKFPLKFFVSMRYYTCRDYHGHCRRTSSRS